MACNHESVTTTYCSECGKRVGYNRPVDLLRHLDKRVEAANKKASLVVKKMGKGDPASARADRDAVKWSEWAGWVLSQMNQEAVLRTGKAVVNES